VRFRRALISELTVLAECSPGMALLALTLMIAHVRGVEISTIPLATVLLSFLAASIVARKSLPKTLKRLYSWKYYDVVAPLLLLPPLLLLLQTGYEYYSLWYYNTILSLMISFTCGLAVFFTLYPVFRRL